MIDDILVGVGRTPNLEGLGLEAAGVPDPAAAATAAVAGLALVTVLLIRFEPGVVHESRAFVRAVVSRGTA